MIERCLGKCKMRAKDGGCILRNKSSEPEDELKNDPSQFTSCVNI